MPVAHGLSQAEYERLQLLEAAAIEVADACAEILVTGYKSVSLSGLPEETNEDFINLRLNELLAIRAKMYELGDMKSKIVNLNQVWRDLLPKTKHQG